MWDSSHVDLTLNDYWRWGLSFCCCCCPVTQLCPTICDPMGYSTSGFPVLHQFPEHTQTHVHQVGDAVQSFHPLSSRLQSFPTSGSFPRSQIFESGGQSIGASVSASVLPINSQDWFPLRLTGWISLQPKGLLRVFSNTTVQNINSLALSLLYGPTLTSIHGNWKNHTFD